jgi:hypothetical protein
MPPPCRRGEEVAVFAKREFIVFVTGTVVLCTRKTVQLQSDLLYSPPPPSGGAICSGLIQSDTLRPSSGPRMPAEDKVNCYNQGGLCAVAFTDNHWNKAPTHIVFVAYNV